MTTVAGFVFVHDLVRITDDSAHHLSVRMTATPLSLLPLKNKKLSDWDVRVNYCFKEKQRAVRAGRLRIS